MIGISINKIREKYHLSQNELAERLSVSEQVIDTWENEQAIPDVYMLEKISMMFHIQMNDLMKGKISKLSEIKYKGKLLFENLWNFSRNHLYYSILFAINMISIILIIFLSPFFMWMYIQIVIFSLLVFLSVKYSRWYILLGVFPFFVLFTDTWRIIDPSSYMIRTYLGELDFLNPLAAWISLSFLILVVLYGIYLFLRKHHGKYYHLLVIATSFLWIVFVKLSTESYRLSIWYSSFRQDYWYVIERNSHFWFYTLGYFILADALLIIHKKSKERMK